MRRVVSLLLLVCILLGGCAGVGEPEKKRYNATFLTLFDTVTTIVGRSESEAAFTAEAQKIHDELLVFHQLFDIYNDYEGVNN